MGIAIRKLFYSLYHGMNSWHSRNVPGLSFIIALTQCLVILIPAFHPNQYDIANSYRYFAPSSPFSKRSGAVFNFPLHHTTAQDDFENYFSLRK